MTIPSLPPSAIRVADHALPLLQAGEYTVEVTQSVVLDNVVSPDAKLRPASVSFVVDAARFRLASDDVYSLYPPKEANGPFANSLPHVVFRRETLPWERTLPKTPGNKDEYPWLALLLFDTEEFAQVAITPAEVGTLATMATTEPGKRGPRIQVCHEEEAANRCLTITVPWRLFRTVAPRKSDLPLLAHARYVDHVAKEDIPGVGDGAFSVVLGNRLPAKGQRNTVALVSLEGHDDLLDDKEPEEKPERVCLVLLAQWSFVCDDSDPGQQMKTICGKDMWLRTAGSAGTAVATALAIGHVPLLHRLRTGNRTVSWYRGPLTPVAPPSEAQGDIFAHADEALEYDEATGMFNASYAAAWQLGRLLAVQASDVATALYRWRHAGIAEKVIEEAQKCLDKPIAPEDAAAVLQDDLLMSVVLDRDEGRR